MRTRSQSPWSRFLHQKNRQLLIEPLRLGIPFQGRKDPLVEPMADTRTMAQLLQAPTEGYEDAILIPEIMANNFELRHGLINLVQNKSSVGHGQRRPALCSYPLLHTRSPPQWDSLNSAAGGNFLDKMPRECLKIIESKSKVRQTRAKAVIAKVSTNSSTQAVSSDVAELKDIVRALLLDKKNQVLATSSSYALSTSS
ncbi:hypothetical protein Tco_1135168 [Tanacetum coccineum]